MVLPWLTIGYDPSQAPGDPSHRALCSLVWRSKGPLERHGDMQASPADPRARHFRNDRIDGEGTWIDPTDSKDVSPTPVIEAYPAVVTVVPAARQAPESVGSQPELARAVLRAAWTTRKDGSDLETRGSLTAVVEFRRRDPDR